MELSSVWLKNSLFTRLLEDYLHGARNVRQSKEARRRSMHEMTHHLTDRNCETPERYPLPLRGALLLLFLLATGVFAQGQVRVWEGTLQLPVYEEGAPDPNPPFDQYASDRFSYPYTLRREITSHRVQHELRAIYLENEYLKCSVLP